MAAEPNTYLRLVHDDTGGVDVAGHVPPHDLDAEVAVISGLMIDDAYVSNIETYLRPNHFYAEAHRWIYEAILATAARAGSNPHRADMVRVGSWLKDRGRIEQVGGMSYLTEILNFVPAVANLDKYAAIVYEKWRTRQIIARCQEIAARGYLDYGETQDYADGAAKSITDLARASIGGDIESNLAALKRIVERLRNAMSPDEATQRTAGILTGISGYDNETGGLHAGQKTTFVALPGVGKTALAVQVAFDVAERGIGVLVFSNEMSREELLERGIARRARVDGRRIKEPKLTESEWNRIAVAMPEIHRMPLLIDDTDDMTIDHVVTTIRIEAERFKRTHGVPLGLVVLDWIQNMTRGPNDHGLKDHEFVKRCTKALAAVVKELKICAIETAQQKPSEIDKVTKLRPKPFKGQVADSSWIEKVSTNVVYLHRNPLRNGADRIVGEDPSSIMLIVTKNRGGQEGELQIRFDGAVQNFECIDASFNSWGKEDR